MKTIYNTISRIGFLAVVGFSGILTGCSNDFDFDEARRENPEFVYKENFEKEFGTIDPNQSWDFTMGGRSYSSTRASFDTDNNPTLTPATDWYEVQKTTIQWLDEHLEEKGDHKDDGAPFIMTMPNNPFTIVPVYQGNASTQYALYLVFGDGTDGKEKVEKLIWTEGQNLEKKQNAGDEWTAVGTGNTMNANAVRAKGVTIDDIAPGTAISMYMLVTQGSGDYSDKGTKLSSLETWANYKGTEGYYHMIELFELTGDAKPTNLPNQTATTDVMLIGCEVAHKAAGDWDYNDAVFLIYGDPKAPDHTVVTDGEVDQIDAKRYMVEDLGATDKSDIDFNDVVIDLQRSRKVKYTYVDGVIDPTKTVTGRWGGYTATVRALGGTKNISVYLGSPSGDNVCIFTKDKYGNPDGDLDVEYSEAYSLNNPAGLNINRGTSASIMYNTFNANKTYKGSTDRYYNTDEVIATIDLSESAVQWDPSTNNIFVKVYDNYRPSDGVQSAETTKVIEFPLDGRIPYMIAVPVRQEWNKERVSVFTKEGEADYQDNFLKLREKNNVF